jgi:UDP-N-acetylglucosamine acyltransferase
MKHHPSNQIHPTAFIGEDVILGENNYIGPNCYIVGDTSIGNGNRFEAFCSIGTIGEDYHNDVKKSDLFIGNNNIFREFTTVNVGTLRSTIVSSNIKMLRGSHVGHDAIIDNDVVISCNVLIGGFSMVYKGANLGLGAIVHQMTKIGHYAMVGMGAIVTKSSNIEPGGIYFGNPAKYVRDNQIGLERHNISADEINRLREIFKNSKNIINEFTS